MLRHFLSQEDLTADEIRSIFASALRMKRERIGSEMAGKSLVMFFEKSSTRTRLSSEIGMTQLGGHAVYLDRDSSQLSRGESIADTAKVVSRYADIMMARVNAHATVTGLAEAATIPVINGLSDEEHPCQSMADLLTVQEHKARVEGSKIAFVGDGNNNVTHSLMLAAAQLGTNICVAAPESLWPNPGYVERARAIAAETGSSVGVTADPYEAVADADVVYTDVWVSMGREEGKAERLALLGPYQVNDALVAGAKSDYLFMHCLPAHIGEEVTESVAYGPNSVIFDEAENRLHVQKALMVFLIQQVEGIAS
jgi:ornithine carbamoyltransferase